MSEAPQESIAQPTPATPVSSSESQTRAFDLGALIDEHQTALLQYVRRLINSREDVEDIVQDAFLRLHRQVEADGIESVNNPVSWLFRVAHNRAMDFRRKHKRRRDHLDRVTMQAQVHAERRHDDQQIDTELVERESIDAAMALLGELPEEQQQIVTLKIMHGLTLREVGEVVGMPLGNVNYRLNKALAALAEKLKEKGTI
jgi:RNA polymerase sigma-70 factor (ECF subfamily)